MPSPPARETLRREAKGARAALDELPLIASFPHGPRAGCFRLSPPTLFCSLLTPTSYEQKILLSLFLSLSLSFSSQSSDDASSALSMALAGRSQSDSFYGGDSLEGSAAARYLERLPAPSLAGGVGVGGNARGQGDAIAALRGAAVAAAAAAAGASSSSTPSSSSRSRSRTRS